MKTKKNILWAGLWVVIAAAVAGILIAGHRLAPQANRETKSHQAANMELPVATSAPAAAATTVLPLAAANHSATIASVAPPEKPDVSTNGQPLAAQSQANQGPSYNGYEVHDPMARVALYFVGTGDPEANAYWESAIFDSGLPGEERKDLIEDLNETGMADTHHPGPADLPLIMARIRLIERLAPYSIDQVDTKAFAEAYNDLVGMANGQAPQ